MAAGKKKKSLTARVKCQHYHTFLIGCFVSTFFFFCICFTIAHNEWLAGKLLLENCCPTAQCRIQNIKSCCRIFFFWFCQHYRRVRRRRDLAGRVVNGCSSAVSSPSRLPGMDAFGVISSVAAHASPGARTTLHNRS